tara:strand:- start:3782 stop:4081 length:300 start_codon:yes stop_codon:yes gene_type:complete
MATKTFKIGEYCKGGIITAETTATSVTIIAKDWDFSQGSNKGSNQSNAKEWDRLEVNLNDTDARRKVDFYLNDLTTCYYSDQVLKWVESQITFKSGFGW